MFPKTLGPPNYGLGWKLDQKTYQKKSAPKADSPYDALMFNNIYKMWRKAGLYIQGSYDLQ